MIMPNTRLLEDVSRERHRELEGAVSGRAPERTGDSIRARVGRALIGAGRALGGESVEVPTRRPVLTRPA